MRRRHSYDDAQAERICERLAAGESLRQICRDPEMPGLTSVYRWLHAHEAFREAYAEARVQQAETFADEILEIADDGRDDWVPGREEGSVKLNLESIQRSKLRIDARKWIAERMAPRKFGQAVLHKHADADGNSRVMDDAEKLARILSILARARAEDDDPD